MANQSRRGFIKNASLGTAAFAVPGFSSGNNAGQRSAEGSPREVWVATISQYFIKGNTMEQLIEAALHQMENAVPFSPDIICLPEVFHLVGVKDRPPLSLTAENGSGNIIGPFQKFAKEHKCSVVCPIYTSENGKYYNAAVIIDREGKRIGEYRKIRLTTRECETLTPGPRNDVPVFKTDFGIIGVQICFDTEWPDAWRQLGEKGAEIVFFPSAFAAGKMVNTHAWQNHYYVVSSTWKGSSKICDITGDEVAASGNYSRWGVCAPINLEKAFLHSWPYNQHFAAIEKKYGRKIRISTLHEEEFTVIESLSADVKVADVMKEFGLKSHREHLRIADEAQRKVLGVERTSG